MHGHTKIGLAGMVRLGGSVVVPLAFVAHQELMRGLPDEGGKRKVNREGRRRKFVSRMITATFLGFVAGIGGTAI